MMMSIAVAQYIQEWLVVCFPRSGYSPEHLAFSIPKGEELDRKKWQSTVDLIYRLVSTGLLDLWPEGMMDGKGELTFDGPLDFAQELARQNPFSFEEAGNKPVPWIGPELFLTEKAKQLIAKHGLDDSVKCDELSIDFINELEEMFEKAGVPWSETPLVPIRD